MRWIEEHKLITSAIAVFIALLVVLVFSFSRAGEATILGKSIQNIFSATTEGPSRVVSGDTPETKAGLKKRVAELEAENEALKKELTEAELSSDQLKELRRLKKVMNYEAAEKNDIVTADITSFDNSIWTNVFTIDVGSEEGVEDGDVVVNESGLVGIVNSVGKHSCKVISIFDSNITVSFKVVRETSIDGILTGTGAGKLSGFVLKADSDIVKGDKVETTGKGIYPGGIEVGTVTKVKYNEDTRLKEVYVKPSVDFRSLRKVSVII